MSEWKTDENGLRYRMFGSCREYAPDYIFTGTPTKQKVDGERWKRERHCPFKRGLAQCLADCAMHTQSSCALAALDEVPDNKDTKGRACPIRGRACAEDCALYAGGCGLRKIISGIARKDN